jgi:hypothetical protein
MFLETKTDYYLPTPTRTWRDVLLRAADLIEQKGLSKQRFVQPSGQICTAMAIYLAANPELNVNPPCSQVVRPTDWVGLPSEAAEHYLKHIDFNEGWSPGSGVCLANNRASSTAKSVARDLREAARVS